MALEVKGLKILSLYLIDIHFYAAFENMVGKGEIARNEQFLLFPHCFLLNQIMVSPLVHMFDIMSLFAAEFWKTPKLAYEVKVKHTDYKENTVEKDKIAHFEQFHLYPYCFLNPFLHSDTF